MIESSCARAGVLVALLGASLPAADSVRTIYIANSTCPDYTWVLNETDTRQAIAALVRAHLDEMKRTDGLAEENRDRYNMMVLQEAIYFIERYPERKEELFRRIREGRIYVSPFLNNSLWGFQSTESAVRTLAPARRFEREWGLRFDTAAHVELPSLPWGTASILAGAGIRWLSLPYLDYDSTFSKLEAPALFEFEGPDGSKIRVAMDHWASQRANYVQGDRFLKDVDRGLLGEWLGHYRGDILANGTHGDYSWKSAEQARPFADAIIHFNEGRSGVRAVNASLTQFYRAADAAGALPALRGCFGHSWEVWPVSLAKYAGLMRTAEKRYLSAEALLSVAALKAPNVASATRSDRERAEWFWTMLADHAWNGSDDKNRVENTRLRKQWSEGLDALAEKLERRAWDAVGVSPSEGEITLFNPLAGARSELVAVEARDEIRSVRLGSKAIPVQRADEGGRAVIYFVSPMVAGYAFATLQLSIEAAPAPTRSAIATPTELDSPYYHLRIDPVTGNLVSLYSKALEAELVQTGPPAAQVIYFDGSEHLMTDVRTAVVASGPLLARLRVEGRIGGIRVSTDVTVHAGLDRVDFDVRMEKPVTKVQERLVHVFPLKVAGVVERIDTTGAVISPYPPPRGDLLPGADRSRFAVQGFVDISAPNGPGVTVAPLEAFVLRTDLGPLAFEALGNDQNYKEVVQDQGGVTQFRFRYSMQAHGRYDGAAVSEWSRRIASPLLLRAGRLRNTPARMPGVNPARALALCLKPGDEGGTILRVWETAGKDGPLEIDVKGFARAVETDLLERDRRALPVRNGRVRLPLRARGFAAVRLVQR